MMADRDAHRTKDSYREESIARLVAMIDKNGGLWEGDMCPECESVFIRHILYLEYNPMSKEAVGLGLYILKCTGCGISVRDIWETKEVWELTAIEG